MSYRCFSCGHPTKDEPPPLMLLNDRRQRIYTALRYAKGNPISQDRLLVAMYATDEWPTPGGYTVMRVAICAINGILAPLHWRICSKRKEGYFLTKHAKSPIKRKKRNGKTIQKAAQGTNP